jgi:hypothetical protein
MFAISHLHRLSATEGCGGKTEAFVGYKSLVSFRYAKNAALTFSTESDDQLLIYSWNATRTLKDSVIALFVFTKISLFRCKFFRQRSASSSTL